MYQALYRKYRPKTFDDVVGQDVVVKTLKNAIINNKISHAYLFSGPRGCGKTSIAKIFARIANCENNGKGMPCNKCVYCTQSNEQDLDIIEMDAASNNGVEEIREINNKVNLVPSLGRYKIYIIDEVHMLTTGAFNALLKTLEEPPKHAIFILATTDPHKVPVTILSRCQRFDFKKISENDIIKKLLDICDLEKIDIEEEAVTEIARLGDGSLRDSISILDQVAAYTKDKITILDVHDVNGTISQKEIKSLVEDIASNNLADSIKKINEYNNCGKSIVKITEDIIFFLRNMLLANAVNGKSDEKNIYREINNHVSVDKLLKYINIVNESLLDMKKFSNPKMILELAFIKIANDNGIKPIINDVFNETTVNEVSKENLTVVNEENHSKTDTIKSSNKSYPDEILAEINKFVQIRINNTLSQFSKKDTIELKKTLKKVNDYVMDEKYNTYASMVLDGELKAVGSDYIIFSYPTEHLTNLFNENINNIEKMLNLIFDKQYKIAAVDLNNWNIIKENFNNKKQVFEYQPEQTTLEEILEKINEKNKDAMQSLFGEIVEYN